MPHSSWIRWHYTAALLSALLVVLPAAGAPTFFTDETAFTTMFPGLPIEDFENATVPGGSTAICTFDALDSMTNYCGGLFGNPAAVLPGFRLGATDNINTTVVSNGAAGVGNASIAVGVNFGNSLLRLVFPGGTAPAVGLHLIGGIVPNQNITVSVYDGDSNLLGSTTVNSAGGTGTFVGIADASTARIDFDGGGNTLPFIDNLRFQFVAIMSDLEIFKSGVNLGNGTGIYTLDVTNHGPDDEPAAFVTDTLPAGVTYLSDSCGLNTAALPSLAWPIGALPANAMVSCEVEVAIQDAGQTENLATVTGQGDPEGSSASAELQLVEEAIPTLGQFGLLALVLALTALGLMRLRSQRRSAGD